MFVKHGICEFILHRNLYFFTFLLQHNLSFADAKIFVLYLKLSDLYHVYTYVQAMPSFLDTDMLSIFFS